MKTCSIEGCADPVVARSWCCRHYNRWAKYGDPQMVLLKISRRGESMRWLEAHISYDGDSCLIWPFAKYVNGYPARSYNRMMCEKAHGPSPTPQHEVAHSCGNGHKSCIHPKHLRWATKKENEDEKDLHGRKPLGEKHWNARLTVDQVREIRALKNQFSISELARRFNVSPGCIEGIVKNYNWRHV